MRANCAYHWSIALKSRSRSGRPFTLTLPTVRLHAAVAPALRGPTPAALLAGVIRASVTAIAVLTHGRATGLDLRSPTGLGHPAEFRKLIAVLVHFAHPLRLELCWLVRGPSSFADSIA